MAPAEPSHARGEVFLSFVHGRDTTSELPGYPRLERYHPGPGWPLSALGLSPNPYYVQFHPLDDVHVNEDDPPAGEVVANTSLRSLPLALLPLKTSLDLGIL